MAQNIYYTVLKKNRSWYFIANSTEFIFIIIFTFNLEYPLYDSNIYIFIIGIDIRAYLLIGLEVELVNKF